MATNIAPPPYSGCLNAESEGITLPQTGLDCAGKRLDWQEQDLKTQVSLRIVCRQFAPTLPAAILESNQHSADSDKSVLYQQQAAVPPQEQAMFANHQSYVECTDVQRLHSRTVKETTHEDFGEQHPPPAYMHESARAQEGVRPAAATVVPVPNGVTAIGNGEPRTTVMIGNIPFSYSRQQFLEELHLLGFSRKTFDFLHLSEGKKGTENRGFAFVNFIEESTALQCFDHVPGHVWTKHQSANVADVKDAAVCWAAIQGYAANLKARKRAVTGRHMSAAKPSSLSSQGSRVPSVTTQQGSGLQVYHF